MDGMFLQDYRIIRLSCSNVRLSVLTFLDLCAFVAKLVATLSSEYSSFLVFGERERVSGVHGVLSGERDCRLKSVSVDVGIGTFFFYPPGYQILA